MESPGRDSCHPKADTYSSASKCILQAPAFPPPVIKTNPPCLHAHNKAMLIFVEYKGYFIKKKKKNQNGKLFKHIEQNGRCSDLYLYQAKKGKLSCSRPPGKAQQHFHFSDMKTFPALLGTARVFDWKSLTRYWSIVLFRTPPSKHLFQSRILSWGTTEHLAQLFLKKDQNAEINTQVVSVNKHNKKKNQPAGRGVSNRQRVQGPWDISWYLPAPCRARIIICGPPSNQEKWHIWPKDGSWFRSTLVLFPVTVPRAAFNLWEVIWIDVMFSRRKGASGQFYPNIAKEVSSG